MTKSKDTGKVALQILWTIAASKDLERIEEYISQENPSAAVRHIIRIIDCVELMLSAAPDSGRTGRVLGTRELIIPNTPYIVPYRIRRSRIEILRVIHASRRWPERL